MVTFLCPHVFGVRDVYKRQEVHHEIKFLQNSRPVSGRLFVFPGCIKPPRFRQTMPRERWFFMPETQKPKLGFCLLAGALAGFINGFFGAGGGMVLVPLLLWLCLLYTSSWPRARRPRWQRTRRPPSWSGPSRPGSDCRARAPRG